MSTALFVPPGGVRLHTITRRPPALFSSLPNLHPFVVHFPIALFSAALALDVGLVAMFRRPWLDRAAVLLYLSGLAASGVAALTGKVSGNALSAGLSERAQDLLGAHGDWAFGTVVLFFLTALLRFDVFWRDRREVPRLTRSRIGALFLAVLAEYALLETASRGGALVYREGVGVRTSERMFEREGRPPRV